MQVRKIQIEFDQEEISRLQYALFVFLRSLQGYQDYDGDDFSFSYLHSLYILTGGDETLSDLKEFWREKEWLKDENQAN